MHCRLSISTYLEILNKKKTFFCCSVILHFQPTKHGNIVIFMFMVISTLSSFVIIMSFAKIAIYFVNLNFSHHFVRNLQKQKKEFLLHLKVSYIY